MKRLPSLAVIALLLFAAAIRLSGMAKDTRLHPDEALYADLSRTMMVAGDGNLIYRTTDKTPLTFFFTGTSIALLGESEFAVRLPGVLFSLIGLAGLYAAGKQLVGEQVGLLALALAAVSPLEIRYAPSAFQDIPMLAMLIIAVWQLTLRRWTSAGFFYGVAVMMKPTVLWVLPVIAMMGGFYNHRRMRSFVPGFTIPILAVILWDWGRPQSLFSAGVSNNNPGRFVRSDEVWPRFELWLEHIRAIFPPGDVLLVLMITVIVWVLVHARKSQVEVTQVNITPSVAGAASPPQTGETFKSAWLRSRFSPFMGRCPKVRGEGGLGKGQGKILELFTAFILIYFAVHWLVAFNTYDRYMLIVAPFVWLTVALVLATGLSERWQFVLVAMVVLGGTPGAFDAAQHDFAPELHDTDRIAETLRVDYRGRIIYDHWLNWELGWYGGGDLWIVYFDTPEDLADHLQGEEGERFFIAPSIDHARVWIHLLSARGIQTKLVLEQNGYVLYSIVP